MLITSKRKFGVEIEFICSSERSIRGIANHINVVHDGSLRPHPYAGEYVSPPITGRAGEMRIHSACETLKRYGADCGHEATSVHVHFDAGMNGRSLRKVMKRPDEECFGVSNAVREKIGVVMIKRTILRGHLFLLEEHGVLINRIDNCVYLSFSPITKHPSANYSYYKSSGEEPFNLVRNALYFYTKYSEVMESIVSNSRRFGNMYCIPLGVSYDAAEIAELNDMDSLRRYWYKNSSSDGHYNNSRYHNVNFHSLWDRHGTIEIRSLGGTSDANKILLWVKLHQKILDKLQSMDIRDIVSDTTDVTELCKEFVSFVEEPILQEFVKRLLGYYSNIVIK